MAPLVFLVMMIMILMGGHCESHREKNDKQLSNKNVRFLVQAMKGRKRERKRDTHHKDAIHVGRGNFDPIEFYLRESMAFIPGSVTFPVVVKVTFSKPPFP